LGEGVIVNYGELDMRKLPSILIAAALGAASLSSLTIPAFAADQDDSVKSARAPYKPGRQIDEEALPAQGSAAAADDSQAVKSAKPPYKPGRELDEDAAAQGGASEGGEQTVKSARPPYKPGREADHQ
jgi:hypothetical protein